MKTYFNFKFKITQISSRTKIDGSVLRSVKIKLITVPQSLRLYLQNFIQIAKLMSDYLYWLFTLYLLSIANPARAQNLSPPLPPQPEPVEPETLVPLEEILPSHLIIT